MTVGWSPLHHAALRAPPTLIVHLLAHGASSLAVTNKLFTPLDLIRAYQPLPDRQDVALILQESMREQGWIGSPLEQRRDRRQRQRDVRNSKNAKSAAEWSCIGQNLGIDDGWWGESSCSTDDLLGGLQVEPESGDDLPDEIIPDEMLVRASCPPDNNSVNLTGLYLSHLLLIITPCSFSLRHPYQTFCNELLSMLIPLCILLAHDQPPRTHSISWLALPAFIVMILG